MPWHELYAKDSQPDFKQIGTYIGTVLWQELCRYLEETYGVKPTIEHSICSAAPGWNVKYKKSGRALCTLYPAEGYFTCMVSIGRKEAMQAELLLSSCTDYVRTLYWAAKPFNGGRWLMIEVRSPAILEDVKDLIATRSKPKAGRIDGPHT